MVLYIFLVAVLNLSVGFTVAVYLGRQYRKLLVLAEVSARQAASPGESASAPATSSLSVNPTEENLLVIEQLGLVESEFENGPGDEPPSEDPSEPRPEIGLGDGAESSQEPDTVEGDSLATDLELDEPAEDSPGASQEDAGLDSAVEVDESDPSKGNRTFVNEGKYPTPVVPPTLDLEEKSVRV